MTQTAHSGPWRLPRKLGTALVAFLLLVAMLAGAGVLAARYFKPTVPEIPTITVNRGEFLVKTYARGDLRTVHSGLIAVPNIGGALVVTQLAPTGTQVSKDEVVLGFDPAEQQNNLATHNSRLEEADQEIAKNRAEAAVREQTERVELLKAEFAVRRAELDISRNELVSEIDAKKNLLTLEAARKRLAQLREDTQSRRQSSEAELAVAREKRNKAGIDLKEAQRRLDQIAVKSPMAGLVSVRPNRSAAGGFWFPGMDIPEYRPGDQAFPGETVMEVVDTAQMEVIVKINEMDRGNLREGQDVLIRPDALPGAALPGKLKSVAGMTSSGFFSFDPNRTFDAVFTLARQDPRLRPGMTVEVEVITERVPNAVYVPAQAVFEREGKKWVFVRAKDRFERREVSTGRRSENQVLIAKGLSGGEEISLLDPEDRKRTGKRPSGPLAATPGARR